MENYIFDNSFEGFMTLIFDFYIRKPKDVKVMPDNLYQASMFDTDFKVVTDTKKASRVYTALKKKLSSKNLKKLQTVFLSEDTEAYQQLFYYCCLVLNNIPEIQNNFGNEHVVYVSKMHRSVNKEKHHYEAFIRFKEVQNNLFLSKIEPKYNIIPLIFYHFKNRYASMNWIIYDLTRKYGIIFNKESQEIQEIKIDFVPKSSLLPTENINPDENIYQELWKSYYKSANIQSRKNTRLHIQLLPKRFWKYLTEK